MKKYSSYFERFEIELTEEQALTCAHQGDCYDDVLYTLKELNLDIDPYDLKNELREYGAWDEQELSDHDMNLARIVWIAAGNIKEEYNLR